MKTRLDVVVQVKERAEDKAGRDLVKAENVLANARTRFDSARATASMDFRTRSDISQWEVQELAHHRAVADANKAKRDLEAAEKSASSMRGHYVNAHRTAEVVRRVADTRRDELQREADKREDKVLDEAASLLWFRKAS